MEGKESRDVFWLSSKLTEAWSSEKVAPLLTKEVLSPVEDNFEGLEEKARANLLLSFLSMKKRQQKSLQASFTSFVKQGKNDKDDWVQVMSDSIEGFLVNGEPNNNLQHPTFQSIVDTLSNLLRQNYDNGFNVYDLPLCAPYLSQPLVQKLKPRTTIQNEHFRVSKNAQPVPSLSSIFKGADNPIDADKAGRAGGPSRRVLTTAPPRSKAKGSGSLFLKRPTTVRSTLGAATPGSARKSVGLAAKAGGYQPSVRTHIVDLAEAAELMSKHADEDRKRQEEARSSKKREREEAKAAREMVREDRKRQREMEREDRKRAKEEEKEKKKQEKERLAEERKKEVQEQRERKQQEKLQKTRPPETKPSKTDYFPAPGPGDAPPLEEHGAAAAATEKTDGLSFSNPYPSGQYMPPTHTPAPYAPTAGVQPQPHPHVGGNGEAADTPAVPTPFGSSGLFGSGVGVGVGGTIAFGTDHQQALVDQLYADALKGLVPEQQEHLKQLINTILANANVITLEGRRQIINFLTGNLQSFGSETTRAVLLSEHTVSDEDPQTGVPKQYVESITFEMDLLKGSWRKVRRRRPIAQ